jgi:hypothetical protein
MQRQLTNAASLLCCLSYNGRGEHALHHDGHEPTVRPARLAASAAKGLAEMTCLGSPRGANWTPLQDFRLPDQICHLGREFLAVHVLIV